MTQNWQRSGGMQARQRAPRSDAPSRPRWVRQVTISAVLIAAAVAAVLVFAAMGGSDDGGGSPTSGSDERLVRADSQRLSDPEAPVATFVEFLDPECEACRAASPTVDELIEAYGDQVAFVVRYLPFHANSEGAARAAEAAAAQGRFADMLEKLFETQPEWGEKQSSQQEYFFGLAEGLGLDMAQFQQVFDDPAIAEKVERDQADARSLGLTGTPSFFLDGVQIQPRSAEELIQFVTDAVNSR